MFFLYILSCIWMPFWKHIVLSSLLALLKCKEIREMSSEERDAKLKELRIELMHQRGIAAMGGAPRSPGKMKALKKNIARILTIMNELKKSK